MSLKIELRKIAIRPKSLRGRSRGDVIYIVKERFVEKKETVKIGAKGKELLKMLALLLLVVIGLLVADGVFGG